MKRHSKKSDIAGGLLKNKKMLYVVLFFAIMNIFSYLMLKQLDAVVFFIIIGFLATYFSKNMIVILLTSIISTFLLVQINMLGSVSEGMEDKTEAAVDASGNEVVTKSETKTDPMTKTLTPPDAKPAEQITGAEREKITASKGEKFTQKLSPARYNAMDDDDMPRHKPKVDYAATLETAYDNLDKLLSSDAIKNMTADTGRLAEKQQLLMGNIEKIAPIMEKAGNILSGFDMGAITKLMGSVGNSSKLMSDAE
jgi:uncharacterized membrane protein YcgQ (UPF0703/DUF1980 family)